MKGQALLRRGSGLRRGLGEGLRQTRCVTDFNFAEQLEGPDKKLFTPGPLSSTASVKQAMLRDWGSRDKKMIDLIATVREDLVALAGVDPAEYTAVLMQGSGTFCVEATITTAVPRDGKILVISNGAYGARAATIAETAGIETARLAYLEDQLPDLEEVDRTLASDPRITHVCCVHSETTSGIMNPIEEVGSIVHRHGRSYIVDAMSSFGAVPVDFAGGHIDYLVSSANKCIQGVPGFAFCIARRDALAASKGLARSVSLDLEAQCRGLDSNGQFRFTPPTHTIIAFKQALDELAAEGGVDGRARRYRENRDIVWEGMGALGFERYLSNEKAGYIITSFRYPEKNWDFEAFYSALSERGMLLYPGKVTNAECFRVGHIGDISQDDSRALVAEVGRLMAAR